MNALNVNNYVIYGCIAIALVLIAILILVLVLCLKKKPKAKGKIKVDEEFITKLVESYGGKENIVGVSVDNARLKVTIKDLELVDLNALKQDSQAGVFVTGSTIKTLFKFDSNLIKSSLEKII